jgi:RNA polymerase sigma-70 factor (ECF subfamily)
MGRDSSRTELGEYAVKLISFKARQLIGQYGFTEADRDDIEQNLTVDLLQRQPKFNPSRASLHTFIDRIVNHAVASLVERQSAACRDYRRNGVSLNDPVAVGGVDDEPTEVGDLIDQDTYLRSTGQPAMHLPDQVALHVYLGRFLSMVPPELSDLCARLAAGQTMSDIARETGIPRPTLYDHRAKLAALADSADLRVYVDSD